MQQTFDFMPVDTLAYEYSIMYYAISSYYARFYFDCLHIASSLDRCNNLIIKDLIVYILHRVTIDVII